MEDTTFDGSAWPCFQKYDGLTVLTLNSSLQYFYMTAIHDMKPLVLSFPLSAQLCIRIPLYPGWSDCSQLLYMLRIRTAFGVLVNGCLAGSWLRDTFFFFLSSLLFQLNPPQNRSTTHRENGENSGLSVISHVGIFRDTALQQTGLPPQSLPVVHFLALGNPAHLVLSACRCLEATGL